MELVRVDTLKAYDEIKKKIILLELQPGASVDENALAGELDVAPTAVREALKLLAHDNLVTVTPRHGIRVAAANLPELRELFEMRLPLESLCAEMAARRATPDDKVVLRSLVREYEQAKGERSLAHLLDLDHRYHSALAQAAHNRYMSETLERFFGLSERLWSLAVPQIDWLIAALDRHAEIVAAVDAGDAGQAGALMSEHVRNFQQHFEDALQAAPARRNRAARQRHPQSDQEG